MAALAITVIVEKGAECVVCRHADLILE